MAAAPPPDWRRTAVVARAVRARLGAVDLPKAGLRFRFGRFFVTVRTRYAGRARLAENPNAAWSAKNRVREASVLFAPARETVDTALVVVVRPNPAATFPSISS